VPADLRGWVLLGVDLLLRRVPRQVGDVGTSVVQPRLAVSALHVQLTLRERDGTLQGLLPHTEVRPTADDVTIKAAFRRLALNPRSASAEIIPTTLNASALRDADDTVIGPARIRFEYQDSRRSVL